MLGPDDLVLCPGTLAPASLSDHIAAAVAGGFQGISLWTMHFNAARERGMSATQIAELFDQNGIEVTALEAILHWAGGAATRAETDAEIDETLEACRALGTRLISAVSLDPELPDPKLAAEGLAHVCDRVADDEIQVCLEFLPWSGVRNLATAWEIIGLADRPNAGLLIDSWHFFRSGADTELLRTIPGDKILCVQLCDAPTQAEPDVEQEAMHRRLLPGAGDAGLAELVRILDAIGSKAPLSIEVFSDELMSLPPVEAACRMGTALRDVRDAARSVTGARGAT